MDFGLEAERMLQWLATFGKDPEGGISRLLYRREWVEAQKALAERMRSYGFVVKYDAVGNLFGRIQGEKYPHETILSGSHVDTVKNGGIYDGQFGIIAAMLAMKHLRECCGIPLRNLEVVSMAEEEGSRFPYVFWGSKNIVGTARREDVEKLKDFDGIPFVEAMSKAGFAFRSSDDTGRKDIQAFLEVHVEQGGVLEREGKSTGVVTHIVGQRRFTIEILGEANHAGTTPMSYRHDAFYATSRIACLIAQRAAEYGDPLVATIGKVEVEPNVVNVVPSRTLFTLDVRHVNKKELVQFTEQIAYEMKRIAKEMGVHIKMNMWMDQDPVPMNEKLVQIFEEQCKKQQLNYRVMHSGAGHDAQIFAAHVPTAMLFVPSHLGLSHSPSEYTDAKDLGEGIQALEGALYELAYKE